MKKFKLEDSFLEIFPEAKIGILVCRGINNQPEAEDKYAAYLEEAGQAAMQYVTEPEFTANPVIRTWRDAFYKFRTKKGARCSIEAMLKRVSKGDTIGCINPLVDLYNGVSLRYGVPVGGENIDAFQGDMRLTVAEGGEDFVTYGSDKSEPPYEGEVVYKDDGGAICRCFNWRESVRTMLTEDTVNAFMCIETVSEADVPRMLEAQAALKKLIEDELCGPDGQVTAYVLDLDCREVVIEE